MKLKRKLLLTYFLNEYYGNGKQSCCVDYYNICCLSLPGSKANFCSIPTVRSIAAPFNFDNLF